MIRHVALFKFKPGCSEQQPSDWIEMLRELLPKKIDEIRSLRVGKDLSNGPHCYDVGLLADFESFANLQAYSIHSEHQPVLDICGPVKEHLVVVDFEVGGTGCHAAQISRSGCQHRSRRITGSPAHQEHFATTKDYT